MSPQDSDAGFAEWQAHAARCGLHLHELPGKGLDGRPSFVLIADDGTAHMVHGYPKLALLLARCAAPAKEAP